MIILQYHEGFFIRLAAPAAMPAHLGAYSLKKTSWYCNIIILLGVEDHPNNLRKYWIHSFEVVAILSYFQHAVQCIEITNVVQSYEKCWKILT